MHCGKLGEFGGIGNLLVQNFHDGYFLHVWDFSLVEKVEYLGFPIILTKLRSSQSNDDFRGCRDFRNTYHQAAKCFIVLFRSFCPCTFHFYGNLCVLHTPELYSPGSLLRDQFQPARCLVDDEAANAPLQIHICENALVFQVSVGLVVVFVKLEAAVCTAVYTDGHSFRISGCFLSKDFLSHRHNGTCFCQNRYGMKVTVHIHLSVAGVYQTCEEINVSTLWQPYMSPGSSNALDRFLRNRRYNKCGSILIFILHCVSRLLCRICVVHWQDQRRVLFICSVVHGIQIRKHLVTES